jgi:hypothetical protein
VARRDLSRTVIEGGRTRRSQYERRRSHRHVRAQERALLHAARFEDEDTFADRPMPRLERAYKIFRDRLGAAKRWLASQCGRPWAHVYSDLRWRFDARTTAGRHVVDDHLLGWVAMDRERLVSRYWRPDFVVDEHGILRRWRDVYARELAIRDRLAGAGGRRAVLTSRGWWWFAGATVNGVADARSFVPQQPLTPGQIAALLSLPTWMQRGLVWRSAPRQLEELLHRTPVPHGRHGG